MGTLNNKVQLIGNVGETPKITVLEGGKKVVRFSLATNSYSKNGDGERVQHAEWHKIVAWGKTAELIAAHAGKGREIALEGKLSSRTYTTSSGESRYITEVVVKEVLLLGNKTQG
ncbi:MAG: single-stranded DNA-binding protein [Bacteroidota bacterium]